MHTKDPVVIVQALRTPIGEFQGCLSRLSATELGAVALRGVLSLSGIDRDDVNEVLMGCVLTAGIGQAPARQATLKAGLSAHTGATTIGKVCGSGMKAVMIAHEQILAEGQGILLAGGMESMSNAPYLEPNARKGYKFGHQHLLDHILYDGLEDAYHQGKVMGAFADDMAKELGITREEQDAYALRSLERAKAATKNKKFEHEIIPLIVTTPKGDVEIMEDEGISLAKPEKVPVLKPAFSKDGTVTAANASSLSDGAAAMLLMKASEAEKRGLRVRARIVAHTTFAQKPDHFTTAPIGAIESVLKKANWSLQEVDLFEINEAFAMVALAAIKHLKLDEEKVNVFGGACVLGHPIGASGARIIATLINALEVTQKHKGIATVCIGGGEALAMAIERF